MVNLQAGEPMIDFETMRLVLRLAEFSTDWPMLCADGSRLNEFATYLIEHDADLDDDAHLELFELVLASAEDAIVSSVRAPELAIFRTALRRVRTNELFLIEHWRTNWAGGFPNIACKELACMLAESR
jgi:hypothetical protein